MGNKQIKDFTQKNSISNSDFILVQNGISLTTQKLSYETLSESLQNGTVYSYPVTLTGLTATTIQLTGQDPETYVGVARIASTTVLLPSSPHIGQKMHIKDEGLTDISTKTLTVCGAGFNIDELSAITYETSGDSFTFFYTGNNKWRII